MTAVTFYGAITVLREKFFTVMEIILKKQKYFLVGFAATAIHVLVSFLIYARTGLSPLAANSLGFVCAVLFSFLSSFHSNLLARNFSPHTLMRFCVLSTLAFATSSLVIFSSILWQWNFLTALLLVAFIFPLISLLLNQVWELNRKRNKSYLSDCSIPLIGIAVFGAFWFYSGTILHHDVSWYLYVTPKWLDGARLYRDIMEINPPLAFYLTAPSVIISRFFDFPLEPTFIALTLGSVFCVLLWINKLLQRAKLPAHFYRYGMLVGAFAALCLVPSAVFGQREHIMVILTLPYIFFCAFKPKISMSERIALGVVAALGLALKPYFYTLPLFWGILIYVRQKSLLALFTPENMAIAMVSIAYAGFVGLFHSEYFSVIIPFGQLVYDAFKAPAAGVILKTLPLLAAYGGVLYITRHLIEDKRAKSVSYTFLTFLSAFGISYFMQFKGWQYQLLPVYAILCLCFVWILCAAFPLLKKKEAKSGFLRINLAFMLIILILQIFTGPYQNLLIRPIISHLEENRDNRTVLMLSDWLSLTFPAANITDATVTSRYPALWLIPGAVSKLNNTDIQLSPSQRNQMEYILHYARLTTTEDFLKGKPQHVIVHIKKDDHRFGGNDFNYLEFFKQDKRFSKEWDHYELIEELSYGATSSSLLGKWRHSMHLNESGTLQIWERKRPYISKASRQK